MHKQLVGKQSITEINSTFHFLKCRRVFQATYHASVLLEKSEHALTLFCHFDLPK